MFVLRRRVSSNPDQLPWDEQIVSRKVRHGVPLLDLDPCAILLPTGTGVRVVSHCCHPKGHTVPEGTRCPFLDPEVARSDLSTSRGSRGIRDKDLFRVGPLDLSLLPHPDPQIFMDVYKEQEHLQHLELLYTHKLLEVLPLEGEVDSQFSPPLCPFLQSCRGGDGSRGLRGGGRPCDVVRVCGSSRG